jgi:glycosyltransferase involved in cell wall biosynthesis
MTPSTPLPDSDRPTLSVVTPMLNEEATIDAFFVRLCPILDSTGLTWEIVCVDDGSTDRTLEVLRTRHAQDPRIRIISLSRNFGLEGALTAGFHHAQGRGVIPIDADLQDPPELIPQLIAAWREGAVVVHAVRADRASDSWFKRTTANTFYGVLRKLGNIDLLANSANYRLIDRQALDVINALPEHDRFFRGLAAWVGFRQTRIYYTREARVGGKSKFNFCRMWNYSLDGITGFSTIPLRFWGYVGVIISLLSLLYAVYTLIYTLFTDATVPGWASLMVVMLFLGGIQLISLGVLGEYIGRLYQESKNRPLYVVKEKIGFAHDHSDTASQSRDT